MFFVGGGRELGGWGPHAGRLPMPHSREAGKGFRREYLALNFGVTGPSTCRDSCWGGVLQISFGAGPRPPLPLPGGGASRKPGVVGNGRCGGERGGCWRSRGGPLLPCAQFKICNLIPWWSQREFRESIFAHSVPPPHCSDSLRAQRRGSPGTQAPKSGLLCPHPTRVRKGLSLGRPRPSGHF